MTDPDEGECFPQRETRTVGDMHKKKSKRGHMTSCTFPPVLWARLRYIASQEGISLMSAIRKTCTLGVRRYKETGVLPTREV